MLLYIFGVDARNSKKRKKTKCLGKKKRTILFYFILILFLLCILFFHSTNRHPFRRTPVWYLLIHRQQRVNPRHSWNTTSAPVDGVAFKTVYPVSCTTTLRLLCSRKEMVFSAVKRYERGKKNQKRTNFFLKRRENKKNENFFFQKRFWVSYQLPPQQEVQCYT